MFKTKIISLLLVFVLLIMSLASCAPSRTRTVGMVGEYEVPYEELYFLAFSYKSGLQAKYGEYEKLDAVKAKQFEDELSELVYTNIVTNYAILSLCKAEGLTLDDDGLDKRVEEYIDKTIMSEFNSDKSAYKESLEQYGMTESYVRFTTSVDMLYSSFMTTLLEKSDVANDNAKMKDIVKNEFVRTWHLAVLNDKGESLEANRAKAQAALNKYRDGSMSMYKLIGSQYNEDLSLTELDGVYFARGSMDENYEKAAFELEIGEVSEVVETTGAFYVIQRLEIEDAYVDKNIHDLKQKYMESVIYEMLEKKKTELKFEPNEFAEGLDIVNLEAPGTNVLVIALVAGGVAVALAGTVVAVILIRKKKSKALVEKKK